MDSARTGGFKSYHLTTNTTNTPWPGTARVLSLIVTVTTAGTSWVITVKNKEGTPKVLYNATAAVGTFVLALTDSGGVDMDGGVDIVTSGTTPGVADVFISAIRMDGL